MMLKEGLLEILSNSDEPLPKRLKIADNAFKSPEVNIRIRHCKLFLLKWLAQTEISNNLEAWKQCNLWLTSDSFREIRSSDIASDDIKIFLERIEEQFKSENEDILNVLVTVVISMIESPMFQHYFRGHLKDYLEFLKNVFENCFKSEILMKLLVRHEKIFGKKIITIPDFHDLVTECLFPCFVNILIKFDQNKDVKLFDCLSNILQKNVFTKRQEHFIKAFSNFEENEETFEILTLNLCQLSKKSNPTYTYYSHKLLYNAIGKSFKQNSELVYKFFAYLVQNLGFSSSKLKFLVNTSAQFDLALNGLSAILEIISVNNFKFAAPINELSFADYLQKLLLCIINVTKRPINAQCFTIIDWVIKISPLTIEANISQLLVYLMCADNETYATQYARTMCNVFDVFSKLHRIQNLISKMIRTLQPVYLDEDYASYLAGLKLDDFEFNGKVSRSLKEDIGEFGGYVELDVEKMLPAVVLEQFSGGTVAMAIKQVSNLFKTFTFHLDALIGLDLAEKSKKTSYVTFIELINRLLCHYLEKMNMSGNFRAANVIVKVTKHMDETQSVLEKFGNALVGIEHNQNLMRTFLQLSYTWGELKILIQQTIIDDNDESMSEVKDKDVELSSCNIACLHAYLSSQTWCLIAERISNFGELPCKKIMEKLWIQKIRFVILSGMDSSTVNEHIASLIQTITPMEDYYEYLLSNEFAASTILNRMDSNSLISIADCVLKDATQNAAILNRVIESRHFVSALVYCIFRKMNKILKKESKASGCEFISCNVFAHVGENFLLDEIDLDGLNVQDYFLNIQVNTVNLNCEKFRDYFTLLKQLPIVFLDKSIQILLFYYLLGVFLDVKNEKQNGDVVNDLGNILLGLAQTKILSLDAILPTKIMVQTVITKFDSADMFSLLLPNQATDVTCLNATFDYLRKHLNDDKHIECLLLLTKHLHKYKKSPELMKTLQANLSQLCDSLLGLVSSNKHKSSIYLEVLIETLQNDKVSITENIVKELGAHLNGLFGENMKISQGELVLFNFAILNDKLRSSREDENVFIANVAKSLTKVEVNKGLLHIYAGNVLLVLQKLENLEEFKQFLGEILQKAMTSIDRLDVFTLEMQVWHQILSSSMKTEKAEVLQKAIEELLVLLFKKIISQNGGDVTDAELIFNVLIDFELHLLQNTQHLLTWTSLDLCFATITQRLEASNGGNFETCFRRSVEILEVLLKYRRGLTCDRLSVFLQEYRFLLSDLCAYSDTTNKQHDDRHFDKMAELAHLLEKLTINLCKLQAHLASVVMYLIADLLKEYETITIYPAVKLALNNCLYNLIALCNQHDIAWLMRALSPGSAEIFKDAYANYKKYHRFTGRV